jgi:hypothetical protein
MQLNTQHYTNKYYTSEQSRTRTPRKQHIRIKKLNVSIATLKHIDLDEGVHHQSERHIWVPE